MPEIACSHQWEMVDVKYGFIVTEKCFHCSKVSNYFTYEHIPPLEEYREGDHFWNFMDSSQTIRFSLKCSKCDLIIPYNELAGLKLCTDCVDGCKVNDLRKTLEREFYVKRIIHCFLPIEERKYLSREKMQYLEDYFNQRRKSSKSKIKIVSQELVKNIDSCYSETILDKDMLSLSLSE